jgi:hypothetical protein
MKGVGITVKEGVETVRSHDPWRLARGYGAGSGINWLGHWPYTTLEPKA